MKSEPSGTGRDALAVALREARPAERPLPPQFTAGVWRRIERAEAAGPGLPAWLLSVLDAMLRPGRIASGVAALMLAGAILGSVQTRTAARETARERYLALVAPNPIR
ncbi:MAG: hypothetical protein H7A45_06605 [Verrucomicrobiales bacterium]|nr:hypothetical protein [Verrucomicrobiales bacterium]MCP5527584.1 hypothetical protein [Verrucomicrobiales bacterium]